jgi:hypothetical protein
MQSGGGEPYAVRHARHMAEGRVWVPETLNALLVDPDDAYIDAWRVQLPAYLDSLAREKNAVYEAVGCGDDFRAYVRVAFEDHTTQRYFVSTRRTSRTSTTSSDAISDTSSPVVIATVSRSRPKNDPSA